MKGTLEEIDRRNQQILDSLDAERYEVLSTSITEHATITEVMDYEVEGLMIIHTDNLDGEIRVFKQDHDFAENLTISNGV